MNAPDNRTDWLSADFVERRVLPLVMAFGAGVLVMGVSADAHYDAELQTARQDAERARQIAAKAVLVAERSQRVSAEYARVCAAATDLPMDSIPFIY